MSVARWRPYAQSVRGAVAVPRCPTAGRSRRSPDGEQVATGEEPDPVDRPAATQGQWGSPAVGHLPQLNDAVGVPAGQQTADGWACASRPVTGRGCRPGCGPEPPSRPAPPPPSCGTRRRPAGTTRPRRSTGSLRARSAPTGWCGGFHRHHRGCAPRTPDGWERSVHRRPAPADCEPRRRARS
jgi:hypothetical protein